MKTSKIYKQFINGIDISKHVNYRFNNNITFARDKKYNKIDIVYLHNYTFLMWLLIYHKKDVLLYLKQYPKQDLNIKDDNGYTALMIACIWCKDSSSIECVKLLLEKGVNPNIQDKSRKRMTALMYACGSCNTTSSIECVKLLLEKGADPNIRAKSGWSALMLACECCNKLSSIECVKLLLEKGADINARAEGLDDWSALMLSIAHCNNSSNMVCIKLLIDTPECDLNLKNKYGDNALTLSKKKFMYEAQSYIKKKMKKENINCDHTECSICLEYLVDGVVYLTCGHGFHINCIYKSYTADNDKCPLCRELI